MNNTNSRNDAILMEILQQRQTVTGFLDSVFGFLRRNTDFFVTSSTSSPDIGFSEENREKIVYECMKRFEIDEEPEPLVVPPLFCTEEIVVTSESPTKEKLEEDLKITENLGNKIFQESDYKNGALFENYCWSQTLKDVEIQIILPPNLQSAKLINVCIRADSIKVGSRNMQPEDIIVKGQLFQKCKHNEALWTISEDHKLIISLDKSKEAWWTKLFINEPDIDIKKLDVERYVDDLDEDAQAAIRKLRAQQIDKDNEKLERQNIMNNENIEKLRLAWNADGSPFKGQPFDPSVLQFS